MLRYIEKLKAPVRISYPGQEPGDGLFSLSPQAQFHEGPETILDLLNSKMRVIPFIRLGDAAVLLLTRLSIDWVVAGSNVNPDLICPPTYRVTREERVQVQFNDGGRIEGLIQMELPEHLNRASDFLNGSEDFYPLATRLGTLLVNKSRVRETRVFEASPKPALAIGDSG